MLAVVLNVAMWLLLELRFCFRWRLHWQWFLVKKLIHFKAVGSLCLKQMQVHGQIVEVRMRFSERLCAAVLCLSCVSVSVTDPAVGSPLRWTISKGQDFKEIPKAIASRRMQFTRAWKQPFFSRSLSSLWLITVFSRLECAFERKIKWYCLESSVVRSRIWNKKLLTSVAVLYIVLLLVSHAVLLLNDMHTYSERAQHLSSVFLPLCKKTQRWLDWLRNVDVKQHWDKQCFSVSKISTVIRAVPLKRLAL